MMASADSATASSNSPFATIAMPRSASPGCKAPSLPAFWPATTPAPTNLDTVYVVVNHDLPDEYLLSRSAAVLFVLKQLPGFWHLTASLLELVPKSLRDAAYTTVARHRYRIFGRSETCVLPDDQNRPRFLDV
jgi:predicted DCC family thiol-disulfide oxidoreductase YuxK